jgi:aminoglycoside phosphotransferase (APT) family kinase protein
VIDEVYRHLSLLDEFNGLSRDQISVEPLQTLAHSEVYRLRIDSRSASLILKRPGPADIAGLADRERRFYRHIAPTLPDWLVPRCIVANDEDQLLVIEDLSRTHQSIQNPSQPTRAECLCLVRALATFHGLTSRPELAAEWTARSGALPAATMDQRVDFFLTILEPFVETLRNRLSAEDVEFVSGLSDMKTQLQASAPSAVSLVHGDAHFGNALFSSAPLACLIDWGMPMVGFGEIDLAHTLALNLPREQARNWESEMVSAYLDQLIACGVPASAAGFEERYRLGIAYSFVSPAVWWRSGVPEPVWMSALSNSLDAARDAGLIK